jgi:hypothetical protein
VRAFGADIHARIFVSECRLALRAGR